MGTYAERSTDGQRRPRTRRALLLVVAGLLACIIVGRVLLRAAPAGPTAPAPAAAQPSRGFPVAVRLPRYVAPPAESEPEANPSTEPRDPSAPVSFEHLLDELVGPRTHGADAGEPRRPIAPEMSTRPEGWKWDALIEMVHQTRYRDLVFTRRRADDQTIAYLAEEWQPSEASDDEVVVAWQRDQHFTDPDGKRPTFSGFYDLAEPYGTILLRIGGQETCSASVLHPPELRIPAYCQAPEHSTGSG
jgi:hypothetical protein